MTTGAYIPGDSTRVRPTLAIAANRLVGLDGEQATVLGQNCPFAAMDAITAGDYGLVYTWHRGSWLVEAGAAIAANSWVMTDANGRAITYVAGPGVKVVGFCVTGASAATHLVEVFPYPPQP